MSAERKRAVWLETRPYLLGVPDPRRAGGGRAPVGWLRAPGCACWFVRV